jgi:hypothetical protein
VKVDYRLLNLLCRGVERVPVLVDLGSGRVYLMGPMIIGHRDIGDRT